MYGSHSFLDIKKMMGLEMDAAKFSNLVNHPDEYWQSIKEKDFLRAQKYIDDNNLWSERNFLREIRDIPDFLYHSLLAFYNIRSDTEKDTIELTSGLWRIYRPSISAPEKYVIGMANIQYDAQSKALTVTESYRGKGDSDDCDKKIKMRSRYQEWFGYLCRKKQKYFIISRDKAVTSTQMTYLPHPSREPLPNGNKTSVVTMSGTIIGVYANHVFTSRVYYERFDGSQHELMEMLDLYDKKDIPEIVCAELDNKIGNKNLPFDYF
jgi:hypothetical protein